MRRVISTALFAFVAILLVSSFAFAQPPRRRFDPDDLEFEEQGTLHGDFAVGVIRGETAGRWLVPDFDLDFGIAPNVELGLDGAWTLEGTETHAFALDHRAPDNLWFSSKVGLWDRHDPGGAGAWAFGAQLGPRAGVAVGSHGAGFQTLLILGRRVRRLRLALNVGGMVDPANDDHSRPRALLTGLDAFLDLDAHGTWSLVGDVSAVLFFSPEKHQLVSTAGVVCSVAPWLDVGVSGLVGFLAGGDHAGAFVTFSPKIAL